jgi:hypothetical protein
MSIQRYVVTALTSFSLALCSASCNSDSPPKIDKKDLLTHVSKMADVDFNGSTTLEEWARVYGELDKHFDYTLSDPSKDLPDYELERYIHNHLLMYDVTTKGHPLKKELVAK